MQKKVRKAVSIILRYQSEVFLIKRQNFLRAFPGYTAFPGGKVENKDTGADEEETLLKAVYREGEEELGVNFEYLHHKEEIDINYMAKATSPEFNPLRFETYFFLIDLNEKFEFELDKNEVKEAFWVEPAKLLQDFYLGNHLMVAPIRYVLKKLDSWDGRIIDCDEMRSRTIPMIEPLGGFFQYMPLSNTVPPATRTNCFVLGEDSNRVMIDPSPKNKNELNEFLEAIEKLKIKKLIISHHHKDHHQFTPTIAEALNIPIHISQDSCERIKKVYGLDYFKENEVVILKDGDVLTVWNEEKVKCYAIPGHDEGHIGFAPESLKWFIVGDLFQGVGTVVVGGDEGNMTKYMDSLQKVIQLKPDCVIPSHGIALGGTHILEKTLEHRLVREDQVYELCSSGHSIEEILKIIYFNIPENILKYARANIESHIVRLKELGKIS